MCADESTGTGRERRAEWRLFRHHGMTSFHTLVPLQARVSRTRQPERVSYAIAHSHNA